MSSELYITQFVRISGHRVYTSQGIVFENQGTSLDVFLGNWYDQLRLNYPKFYKMDRQSKLGLLATEVLLAPRQLSSEYLPESIAIILSNAQASLDTDQRYYESTKTFASPGLFVYTLANIVVGEISIRQKIKGENAFFVSPEFDARWMSDYVSLVMSNPSTQASIAGWVDLQMDQADVLLYLTEKRMGGESVPHTATKLTELYKNELWKS